MTKPDVKKYLNAYQFLQEMYEYRKNLNADFSYDVWSQELNAGDKSYVRFMILGKRSINEQMSKAFAANLALSDSEKEYFEYLVQYTQSKTPEQKSLFAKKLIQLLEHDLNQNEVGLQYDFLSNPLMPRLQVLLSFSDLNTRPENLAFILGCSAEEIVICLDKLSGMQMIEKTDKGFANLNKNFKVPDGFGDIGLEAFYIHNLEIAKKAIQLPKEERRFKSLFLPLNKEEFKEFLASLQIFVREQLGRYNSSEYADRRLYQVHMNIIPVSAEQRDSETSDFLLNF